ncbi:CheY-like chemotaxis protein [Hoeflea marina]|uniref:CheY-like chemotaxis protein n=1 Tax=Hoeflea marina TaxID=274592 RepID=A0A317PCG9_9HYPH|nr:response regulator [Hoeflea marina]PWV95608.1 CheY-like chemotaxis protein [Hoeflea marina]
MAQPLQLNPFLSVLRRIIDHGWRFVLPSDEQPGLPMERGSPPLPERSCIDVLIVETDEVDLIILSYACACMGYSFRVARSGNESAALCELFQPRLVLVDLSLPTHEVMKACRTFRALWRDPSDEIAIIGMLCPAAEGEAILLQETGIGHVLSKPVSAVRVREVLQGRITAGVIDIAA